MAIDFACSCGKRYRVDDKFAGRETNCKQCGARVLVPQPDVPLDAFESSDDFYALENPPASPHLQAGPVSSYLAGDTAASLPVMLGINWAQYIQCFPVLPLCLGLMSLFAAVLALAIHPGFWALPALALGVGFLWTRRERAKFITGDLNPGIVVADSPWRVAVCTDLTTGQGGSHYVLKIVKQPLDRMTAGPPRIGMPVATGAIYAGDPSTPAWSNFFPTVLNCGSTNLAGLELTIQRIPESLWRRLAAALEQVDSRQAGLYPVHFDDEPAAVSQAARRGASAAAPDGSAKTSKTKIRSTVGTIAIAIIVAAVKIGFKEADRRKNQQAPPPQARQQAPPVPGLAAAPQPPNFQQPNLQQPGIQQQPGFPPNFQQPQPPAAQAPVAQAPAAPMPAAQSPANQPPAAPSAQAADAFESARANAQKRREEMQARAKARMDAAANRAAQPPKAAASPPRIAPPAPGEGQPVEVKKAGKWIPARELGRDGRRVHVYLEDGSQLPDRWLPESTVRPRP